MNAALRRNRIIGIICLGALGIGLWQYVLAPRFLEPETDAKATVSQTEKAAGLSIQYKTLMTKAKSLEGPSQQAAALNVSIPADAQIPQLQGFIWGVGDSVGISNANTDLSQYSSLTEGMAASQAPVAGTPAPSAPAAGVVLGGTVYETTITVTATGSYSQVMAFVTGLSKAPRTIKVGHVAVASSAVRGSGNFTVTVEGVAYVSQAIPAAPTAETIAAADGTTATGEVPVLPAASK